MSDVKDKSEEGSGIEEIQKPFYKSGDPRARPADFAPSFDDLEFAGIPDSPPVTDKGASTLQLRPRKLSHRMKYVAQLAAMGCTQKEICQRTGYSQHRMSVILNSPLVSNEVERTRRFVFERDAERALKTMLPKALETIHETLNHPTPGFRELRSKADVAFTLLEHTHGKPKQRVEVGGNLLADLYNMLDRNQNGPQTFESVGHEVEDAELAPMSQGEAFTVGALPEPRDELDAFLDKTLNQPKEPLHDKK